MPDLSAKRTLVKSPPELWSELSEVEGLARHLGEFGEIRITRLEPERTVAWEGAHARGTVEIEPSGWGTRVVLSASVPEVEAPPVREPAPAGQPAPVESARPPRRWRGVVERLFPGFWAVPPEAPPQAGPDPAEPEPAEPEPPAPEASEGPEQIDEERARAVLDGALDSLGSAHHRPFSRG